MRVLIAVDTTFEGAAIAEQTLKSMAPWLRATGSETYLLSVLDLREAQATISGDERPILSTMVYWSGFASVVAGTPRHLAESRSQAIARIEGEQRERLEALALAHLAGLPHHVHLESSRDVPDTIVHCARELDVDLIAMGTRARHGLQRTLLGSVSEEVIRRAPVPVAIVRRGMQRPHEVEDVRTATVDADGDRKPGAEDLQSTRSRKSARQAGVIALGVLAAGLGAVGARRVRNR